MPTLTNLSLVNHGYSLANSLKIFLETIPTDLEILCSDGKLKCHKVIFVSQCKNQSLVKALASNPEETAQIVLPDVSSVLLQEIIQLLYTGKLNSQVEINEIDNLTRILQLKKFNLTPDDDEIQDTSEFKLEVREIEKKKRVKASKTDVEIREDQVSEGPRRSKRPKLKTKHLKDFETPYKDGSDEFSQTELQGE